MDIKEGHEIKGAEEYGKMKLTRVLISLRPDVLKKLDACKDEKGFASRTPMIIHMINEYYDRKFQ